MRSTDTPKTPGQLRDYLAALLPKAIDGTLSPERGHLVTKVAEKINGSFAAENNTNRLLISAGKQPYALGHMPLGEDKEQTNE